MKNLVKVAVAGVAGLFSTQASASASFEKDLYQETIEQGTVEAAETFLEAFPHSAYASEISAMLAKGIRSELRAGKFASAISSVEVTYSAAGYAETSATPPKAKGSSRKARRRARRAQRRAYIRQIRQRILQLKQRIRDKKNGGGGGGY